MGAAAVENKKKSRNRSNSRVTPRDKSGVRDPEQRKKIKKMEKKVQKKTFGNMGKAGESDRHIGVKMPKHLFAGKRKMGKTDRRLAMPIQFIILISRIEFNLVIKYRLMSMFRI